MNRQRPLVHGARPHQAWVPNDDSWHPNGRGSRWYKLYTLIPFLTQPPHECPLTGWGSWVYPNGRGSWVRPGRGMRCAWASPLAARTACSQLGLRPHGLRRLRNKIKNHTLYEFVLYNLYKNCMNWYKNHTVVEFVLYNLYNNCMNLFVWIHTKISEKKLYPGWDFNPGPISRLKSSLSLPSTTPSPPSVAILFIYHTIKKTIRKTRLYYTGQLRKPSKN
jgi:hypothetical protein